MRTVIRVTRADLLLHPIRLRIVQQFLGHGELTTAALRAELADVPTATLYRQITALLDGGILEIVDERKVRGAVERTFVLRTDQTSVGAAEAATMSAEEHQRSFLTFVVGLLADYDRYLGTDGFDLARDRVGYRQTALHLSDEEMDELLTALRQLVQSRMSNQPGPGRKRRLLTTILMPAVQATDGP